MVVAKKNLEQVVEGRGLGGGGGRWTSKLAERLNIMAIDRLPRGRDLDLGFALRAERSATGAEMGMSVKAGIIAQNGCMLCE